MEAPISASLGAMGSLLRKLDEILAAEHKDEIWGLREDLEITSNLLLKLSRARDPPVTARYWMKDVRELSYDMEDAVDAETDWIDEKMSGFRTLVEEANERYHSYMLEDSVPSCADISIDCRRPPTVDSRKALVGLHAEGGPIDTLCQWLSDQDPELKLVSIVGAGGIGKTTLADQLWHKLGAFQCRAFVRSSKKPDMRGILRSILSQVRPHQPPGLSDVHSLTQDIYKHLQDKSYFVIIDDIWATSVWEVASRAFPEGNHGSRIVTTTETEDVALACCAYQTRYIYKMEPLSVQHSKELFTSALFGSREKELDECSHEIMRRCCGLPQAIVSIASILASNQETETMKNTEKAGEQGNYLHNFVLNDLAADTPIEEILKIVLNLCYTSLPSCLQTCLLYLSIYSENCIIFKEDLTKQWIVEGFICASTKKETMEVAQSYFDKLVNMGLIQHIDVKNIHELLSYAVHPMVHDFITSKSIEENFVTAMDYSQSTMQFPDKVRRLSLQFGCAAYATTPASSRLSQVRSLTFIGLVKCMPSISEFKLLRVLILNFWGDQGSTISDLARISELFLLRYLQIICNVIVQLPDQMQGLEHLETLEINARPDWSMLHLCLKGGTNLPEVTMYPSSSSTSILNSKLCYPFDPVKTSELLPPMCSIPKWIGQLNKLCTLKIVVRELLNDDIGSLGGLSALTVLSLYVQRRTAEIIVLNTAQFAALEYFEFKCGVLSLAFQKGTMPNLQMLKLGFNAHKGEQYGHFFAGIEHLSNLKEVVGIIGVAGGAEEPDWRAAESAFKDAISLYSKRYSEVNVKRADWIEEEYYSPENQHLIQEKHPRSEQPGKIKEESDNDIQEKHSPSEQPGKIKEETNKDIKQNADSESASALPLLLHPDTKQNESISRTLCMVVLLGSATSLLHNMVKLLSDVSLAAYVDSLELGHNSEQITAKLLHTLGLLDNAQRSDVGHSRGLQGLLENLTRMAYQVEDLLDEVNYFQIQDKLHGTVYTTTQQVGANDPAVGSEPRCATNSSVADGDTLHFDRVSGKIKSKLQDMLIQCDSVSDLLGKIPTSSSAAAVHWPQIGSTIIQDTLYGRRDTFEETVSRIISCDHTISVLPIVGPGGIGKTTFAQHIYSDDRTKNYFKVRVWVCVSTDFDVLKLTREILGCIHATEPGSNGVANETLDLDQLQKSIAHSLKSKRFLIVLDDIWKCDSEDQWKTLLAPFTEGEVTGSLVIVTTRFPKLAHMMMTTETLELPGLESNDFFTFFEACIFGDCKPKGYDYELAGIAVKIASKLKGSPLAAKTVGKLLQKDLSREHWNRVLKITSG